MLNTEIGKEILNLYQDKYVRNLSTIALSIPAIFSFLAITQGKPILLVFAVYFYVVAFIFSNSLYVFFAYKPSEIYSGRLIPIYPLLHRYTTAGFAISVLMILLAITIRQSPISFQQVLQEWSTPTPTITLTTTPTITLTKTLTIEPSQTFTQTATATNTLTPTLIPTSTHTPSSTPDPEQFRGFDKNCIEQKYWSVSVFTGETEPPSSKKNSKICYDLLHKGVFAQDQGLRFNVSQLTSPFFGIHTSLPSQPNFDIHFNLKIDTFVQGSNSADGVLIFGVSDQNDWNFKNGNYLFYSVRNVHNSEDIHLEVGTSKILPSQDWGIVVPRKSADILFSIRGVDLYISVDNKTTDYYPRSLSQLDGQGVFWIGYQVPTGKGKLQASLTNFSIIEK
jgi:hypothetical protein